ncbi:MAG: TIGR04076 family protein [Clostridia bacterium]|nr:TIGR04076 family protein [Clostridia bacterium]
MSKGKDEGIGQICPSKPTWFDSRSANHIDSIKELIKCPEGFCHTAWNCIYQYVFALANGGGKQGFFYDDWTKEPGIAISSCNDGFRPVIFKLEATDIPSEK